MRQTSLLLLTSLVLLLAPGCGREDLSRADDATVQQAFDKGLDWYDKNRLDLAAPIFRNVADSRPEWDDSDLALFLHAACFEYMDDRNFDTAIEQYQRVVDTYPDSPWAPEALYRIAECHALNYLYDFAKHDYHAARVKLEELVKRYPESRTAAMASLSLCDTRSMKYRYSEEGHRQTVEKLKAFVAKYPDSPLCAIAHHNIGVEHVLYLHDSREDWEEAVEHFAKAMQLGNPDYMTHGEDLYRLAAICDTHLNRPEEALKWYRETRKVAPLAWYAAKVVNRIEALEKSSGERGVE